MAEHTQIVLRSNCIFDGTGAEPFSGYVVTRDERILQVVQGDLPSELAHGSTVYELGNRTICPGFADAHTFFTGWALNYLGVDLSPATDSSQIGQIALTYANSLPPEKPVWGHGWDPTIVTGGPQNLDRVFPDRPAVLFAAGAETFWINSAAIQRYGFDNSADCNEVFWQLMEEFLADHAFSKPLFQHYMQMLNRQGVTSVKEIGYDTFSTFPEVLEQLERDNAMTLRVHFMSQPVKEGANLDYARRMRQRFQGEFVRFSGFNRMTDGSISQMCGYLKQPYRCAPDTQCAQEIDWALIEREVLQADAEGFRFSLNAQGDAAVARVLDIYEKCCRDSRGKVCNRHAITEAEFSDPQDLERMGQLGVICEFYPQIQSIADRAGKVGMIEEKLGTERGAGYWNRRKMADSGVLLCCGTDLPLVIDDIPQSLYHSVTGKFPEGGEPFHPENTLTVSEVLQAWTSGGAYDMYREGDIGTLAPGNKADIAVLDANVFAMPIDEVRKAKVCLTLVNGAVVYDVWSMEG